MIIKGRQMLNEFLQADLYRYCGKTDKKSMRKYRRKSGGFRFTYYMRKCNYYRNQKNIKFLLFPFYKHKKDKTGIKFGFDIYDMTQIGKGFHIAHISGVVVHNEAVIGKNVSISHCVTIGQTKRNGEVLTPVIGDNVYIAPGAKVIGGISIGNNSVIGANAVVTKDVPENAVVAGVPAKVLSYKGSADYLINPLIDKRN